jgi:hypothetical protein
MRGAFPDEQQAEVRRAPFDVGRELIGDPGFSVHLLEAHSQGGTQAAIFQPRRPEVEGKQTQAVHRDAEASSSASRVCSASRSEIRSRSICSHRLASLAVWTVLSWMSAAIRAHSLSLAEMRWWSAA